MDPEKIVGHPSIIHQFTSGSIIQLKFTCHVKLIGGKLRREGAEIVEIFWEYSILEIYNLQGRFASTPRYTM